MAYRNYGCRPRLIRHGVTPIFNIVLPKWVCLRGGAPESAGRAIGLSPHTPTCERLGPSPPHFLIRIYAHALSRPSMI